MSYIVTFESNKSTEYYSFTNKEQIVLALLRKINNYNDYFYQYTCKCGNKIVIKDGGDSGWCSNGKVNIVDWKYYFDTIVKTDDPCETTVNSYGKTVTINCHCHINYESDDTTIVMRDVIKRIMDNSEIEQDFQHFTFIMKENKDHTPIVVLYEKDNVINMLRERVKYFDQVIEKMDSIMEASINIKHLSSVSKQLLKTEEEENLN